jgi:hypothetical protein
MKDKSFDAVEMKNAIQARHRQERAGMSAEQVRQSVAERLGTADHPLLRKWRGLAPEQSKTSSVASAT